MEVLVFLVPLALLLGTLGLIGFLWSLRSGQYEDLEGAAWHAIADDAPASDEALLTLRQRPNESSLLPREPFLR